MPLAVIRGFFIMVVMIVVGVIGTIAFGTMSDYLVSYSMMFRAQMGINIPEAWDTTPVAISTLSVIHITFRMLPIVGIFCFIVSIFQKTRYDESVVLSEDEYQPWEGY